MFRAEAEGLCAVAKRNPATSRHIVRLSRTKAQERIEALRAEIRRHDYLYYVKNRPRISDEKYDRLFERLKKLEKSFPDLITADSPTQRVGAQPRDEFPVIRHTGRLLSLDASREASEVRRFDERVRKAVGKAVRYVVEEKFDGASVELVYEGGLLARGVTRGNGREGEGVTENVKTISSVPLRLRDNELEAPRLLALRGEVIMKLSAFEALNRRLLEAGNEPFANPRNAAAGSLRQLDPRVTAERPLELVTYEVLAVEGRRFRADTEALEALRAWGLPTPTKVVIANSIDAVVKHHDRWAEQRERLDYEIDGIVVKVDDLAAREKLGSTSHHPRWAMAFKFEPRREITRVLDIVAQVGRTGVLTPVALMRPVQVGGVTVSRASLHNREEIERKDVRVGDQVRIQRAGDVIPEVVERIPEPGRRRQKPYRMPSRCPSCKEKVIGRGPYTVCTNHFGCPAQLKGRLRHFGSKEALDIDGLGAETVSALVDHELVRGPAGLFYLAADDVRTLEGFGARSAQQLVAAIEKRKRVELRRFLYALGIPGVGATVARDLADHFGRLAAVRRASRQQLEQVAGIGPNLSQAIQEFFRDTRNQKAIDALLEAGVRVAGVGKRRQQPLAGKRFVLTGALERFTRSEAERLIESLGGRASSAVSRETDYLVVGENPGQKLEDAKEHQVTTLSEQKFAALLRRAGAKV